MSTRSQRLTSLCLYTILALGFWLLDGMAQQGTPLLADITQINVRAEKDEPKYLDFTLLNKNSSPLKIERIVISRGVSDDQVHLIPWCCLACMLGWYLNEKDQIALGEQGVMTAERLWSITSGSEGATWRKGRTMFAAGCRRPLFIQLELDAPTVLPSNDSQHVSISTQSPPSDQPIPGKFVLNKLIAQRNNICVLVYFDQGNPARQCWKEDYQAPYFL